MRRYRANSLLNWSAGHRQRGGAVLSHPIGVCFSLLSESPHSQCSLMQLMTALLSFLCVSSRPMRHRPAPYCPPHLLLDTLADRLYDLASHVVSISEARSYPMPALSPDERSTVSILPGSDPPWWSCCCAPSVMTLPPCKTLKRVGLFCFPIKHSTHTVK